eukprot:5840675-Amphidinium_carterae.1
MARNTFTFVQLSYSSYAMNGARAILSQAKKQICYRRYCTKSQPKKISECFWSFYMRHPSWEMRPPALLQRGAPCIRHLPFQTEPASFAHHDNPDVLRHWNNKKSPECEQGHTKDS